MTRPLYLIRRLRKANPSISFQFGIFFEQNLQHHSPIIFGNTANNEEMKIMCSLGPIIRRITSRFHRERLRHTQTHFSIIREKPLRHHIAEATTIVVIADNQAKITEMRMREIKGLFRRILAVLARVFPIAESLLTLIIMTGRNVMKSLIKGGEIRFGVIGKIKLSFP